MKTEKRTYKHLETFVIMSSYHYIIREKDPGQ